MISTKAVMAFRIVSLFLVLFVHTAPQPMTSDTTLYSSHVPSSVMESSYVKKRCYHMNMSFTYNVSSGVSLSKNEAQTFMQSYVAPLLRRSLPLIDIGCSKSLTLTTGQTFTSPPGQVNMSVGASFTFAASRTIPDHRVDTFLQNCMALMRTKLAAWSIQQRLAVLNVSGVIYSANGVYFSRPRSCCGARPPPCNASISSSQEVTATISGSVMSTKQVLARSHLLTPALSSTAMLSSSTCVEMVSTVCIQSVPSPLMTSAWIWIRRYVAPFTSVPDNPTFVTLGSDAELKWEFPIGADFKHVEIQFEDTQGIFIVLVFKKKDGTVIANPNIVVPKNLTSRVTIRGNATFVISNVQLEDTKYRYRCSYVRTVGPPTTESAIQLVVKDSPKFTTHPENLTATEGENVILCCSVRGEPIPDIVWRKDGSILDLQVLPRFSTYSVRDTSSLQVRTVSKFDHGEYSCWANNRAGNTTSYPGILTVNYPPSINKQIQLHIRVPVGAQLRLECAASGNPYPQITWTKDKSSKIPKARFSDRRRVLTVDSVRVDDIGEYQCAASNLLGHAVGNRISVDVETLLTIINDGENFTVTEGDEVKLRCQASSLITPKLTWKRGDTRLESIQDEVSDDGKVVSGYLILEDVKREEAGQYVCIARNGQKSVEAKMVLTVNVKIVVEMELKLEGEEFSAGLKNSSSPEFRELASEFEKELSLLYQNMIGFKRVEVLEFRNGSVDVRFRVILVIKVKTPEEEPPPDVKVKVTRVVVVKVTESKGKIGKLRIKPESVRPKVEPPAPRNLTTVAIQKTEIRLIWSPPEFHEVYQVLKYIVEFKRFGKEWEERKTANNHIMSHRLLDLEADASYSVKVSATNEYGISIPSPILTTRTLSDREDMYWKIWLPVIIVVGVVLLLLVVYFCRRKRRSEIDYSNRLKEEERADIRLKYLNYACEEHEISEDDDLAQRMLKGTWLEVSRDALVLGGELGSGMFGRVVKAWLQRKSGETQVCAVKMLKANATELEYRDLANEVEIMSNVGEHPNLINLIGVCSIKGPLYVIVEFAEHGSLLEYLRQGRNDVNSNGLTNIEKFTIALGVAKGMNHLATMKCVHRDLSARNVLLAENMTPKVADFGLSRDVYERGFYEKTTGGKLPARWMAIEALERMMCTSEGDVWSFGVLLWEIETGGKMPYAGLEVKNLLKQLKSGCRLEKPIHCTDDIYDIMMRCWHGDPAKRPTFLGLCSELETFINGSPK